MDLFSSVTNGRKQSDGAFTVLLGACDRFCRHQIQVEVSAPPAGGTLAVAVRSPGAAGFATLDGGFDLTGSDLLKTFGPCFAAEIRFTPEGFDAEKTYDVIVTSGADG